MKLSSRILCVMIALFAVVRSTSAEPLTARTASGATVQVLAELPAGTGPFAAIVLAPGQAYPMNLPALAQSAQALLARGIAVYRFDWSAYSASGRPVIPSAEFADERADLSAVLALMRSNPRIDKTRISVGGKSLGSLVAWRVFEVDAALRSAILLTPICGQSAGIAERNYPGFAHEKRALLLIAGDHDPLCAASLLPAFAATAGAGARVAIVGGDHGFEDPALSGEAAQAALDRNLKAVTSQVAAFAASPAPAK